MRRYEPRSPHLNHITVLALGRTIELRPVSIHEAGHLVLCLEHGFAIEWAEIHPATASFNRLGRARLGHVRRQTTRQILGSARPLFEPTELAIVERSIEVSLAGRIAVEIATGDADFARIGSTGDHRLVEQTIRRYLLTGDMPRREYLWLQQSIIDRLTASTRSTLARQMDVLLLLAARLDNYERLSGADVQRIAQFEGQRIYPGTTQGYTSWSMFDILQLGQRKCRARALCASATSPQLA
jgi:hypothetical protein